MTAKTVTGWERPRTCTLTIWNEVCKLARVKGRTPHAARHAMGRHIMSKTGNVAAVQREVGHKNAAYSLQYARITDAEQEVVDERTAVEGPPYFCATTLIW